MPEHKAAVKSSGAASAAIATPRGLELDMASLSTWSRAHTGVPTILRTANGVVGERTVVTPGEITPDRSSPLSVPDEQRLYRIQQDREKGFMVSGVDVDFLLEVVERLSR